MLLKYLKLRNFRQFKGEQMINFATDIEKNKNVTIILGENGSGKTSLAQAFTWCLYGDTSFEDKILLCKAVSQSMPSGQDELVRVELSLIHSNTEYIIISEQRYRKNDVGVIIPNHRKFTIAYKNKDGQQEFIPDLQTEMRMKEILPSELSKYFFFDGERIGNMSKALRKGKSREFEDAVRNLLGLSAFTEAIRHLKGQGSSKSVIRSYDEKYDSKNDSRIEEYTKKISDYNSEIERIDSRLQEIEREKDLVDEKIRTLSDKIKENENSKELAELRAKLISRRLTLVTQKNNQITDLLKVFNRSAPIYFAKKMMRDCFEQLSIDHKLDNNIPDIHARTVDYIIENGRCICGSKVCTGNDAFNELNRLRDYIPPKSLGKLIEEFRTICETNVKNTESFFIDFCQKYSDIRLFDTDNNENEAEIDQITKRLENMDDVGKLQAELSRYETQSRNLQNERSECDKSKGSNETNRNRMETERHELTLKDKNNKQIETYKAYAQHLYDVISYEYAKEEAHVRNELSKVIDRIFRSIYKGGFSLSLDEKYNVQVIVNDFAGYSEDVETSTAQSISIIFAFIAGVIEMARASQNPDNIKLISEPYPLVMDAPLSTFDKLRIETVCKVLPEVAEQIIIFIKDTDGELAEKYLNERIGNRAVFRKCNEFETYIE